MINEEPSLSKKKTHELFTAPLIQEGFNSAIRSIFLSKNTIAVLSDDGLLMLWDKVTLEKTIIILETKPLQAIKSLTDTTLIAYANDGESFIYEFYNANARPSRTTQFSSPIKKVYDTHKFTAFLQENAVSIYDKRTKTWALFNYPVLDATTLTLWEELCFVGTTNGSIEIIDLIHKENIFTLHGHKNEITGLLFWDYKLISSSLDETIKIWDPISYSEIHTIDGLEAITSMASKNNILVAGSESGIIRLFDMNTYQLITTLWGHIIEITALSIDDDVIVSGGANGEIRIWDATLYNEQKHIPPAILIPQITGNRSWIVSYNGMNFSFWAHFQNAPNTTLSLPIKEFKDMGIYKDVLLIRDKKSLYTIDLNTKKQIKLSKKIKHKSAHHFYEFYPAFIKRNSAVIAKFLYETEKEFFDQLLLQKAQLDEEHIDLLQKILDPIPNKVPYVKHIETTFMVYTPIGITIYFKPTT